MDKDNYYLLLSMFTDSHFVLPAPPAVPSDKRPYEKLKAKVNMLITIHIVKLVGSQVKEGIHCKNASMRIDAWIPLLNLKFCS